MIKTGIIEGAGFTGGELIRLLLNHPDVLLIFITGRGNSGQYIHEVHRGLYGNEEYQQMVLVKDIELYSTCEHHVMPFIGKAHVAYIPNGTITGLSKIARVVETFARRLQVQERLTTQIRDCIQDTLNPLGVAVVIEASHTCMTLRGVQKANAVTTTSAFSGIFLKDERTRNEFLNLIR